MALWDKELKMHKATDVSEIDLSVLAKISDGYTAQDITFSVRTVMTPMRKKQQAFKAVQNAEFVPALAQREPVFMEEEKEYLDWYIRLTLFLSNMDSFYLFIYLFIIRVIFYLFFWPQSNDKVAALLVLGFDYV